MNTSIPTEKTGQSRSIESDPQFFGLYLNLACLNIMEVDNHIRGKVGEDLITQEEKFLEEFLIGKEKELPDDQWTTVYHLSRRYLPFLHLFDSDSGNDKKHDSLTGIKPTQAKELITTIYSTLIQLRHSFSHNRCETDVHKYLIVSKKVSGFIKKAYAFALDRAQRRLSNVLGTEDFATAKRKEGELLKEENSIVSLSVDGSVDGLVFFICLFLDREQAYSMLSRTTGFKRTNANWARAVHETFCDLCVRHPHDKLESTDRRAALLLDMLNELNRCPKILYKMLSEKERQKFLPTLDEAGLYNLSKNSPNDNDRESLDDADDWAEPLTKRIRHQDRFPYLLLRFIEEMDLLPGIHFRIDLGQVELASYDKHVGTNSAFKRTVTDQAMAFGKLSDLQDVSEVEDRINRESAEEERLRFSLFSPRYAIYDNKIGYSFASDCAAVSLNRTTGKYTLSQPEAAGFISMRDLRKLVLMELLQSGSFSRMQEEFSKKIGNLFDATAREEPSLSNLFSEPYHRFIRPLKIKNAKTRRTVEEHEATYQAKIKERKEKLNDILTEYGLDHREVPSRLLDEWMRIKPAHNKMKLQAYVKTQNDQCRQRERALKERSDGKTRSIPLVGEMATFLSQDIIRMVISEECKKRITSVYYNELQRTLAQYAGEENRKQFAAIVRELHLYDPKKGHPFLSAVMLKRHTYTEDFYSDYLAEKREWIRKTFYKKEKDEKTRKLISVFYVPEHVQQLPLLIQRLIKRQNDLPTWLNNKRAHPKDLPSHLFDRKLLELLAAQGIAIEAGRTKWNDAFKEWWDHNYPRGVQSFYTAPREVEVCERIVRYQPSEGKKYKEWYESLIPKVAQERKAQLKKEGKPIPPNLDTDIKRTFHRAINEQEFLLRLTQEDDRLMLMAIKQMMSGQEQYREEEGILSLGDIDSLLNKEVTFELAVNANGVADGKATKATVPARIIAKSKRKEKSKYIHYCYDRRVPGLMSHFPDYKAELEEVRSLLGEYNRCRIKIFDWAFALEGAIMSDPDLQLHLPDENKIPNHRALVELLVDKKKCLSAEDKEFLIHIRNKAAHNEFPPYKDNLIERKEGKSLVGALWERYESIIRNILPIIDPENRFFGELMGDISQSTNGLHKVG
ncbi:type VI-B CRISPR-associated RNA-guided ribonuclease Cas13b [Porphyromonas loveana]|uniref:type VI-B CRISPR-associated RNA-guided ribonuclease Cas13b n=1 Tax=Porphyromonas loveana TaxID=1884669 RepID=UPI0035A0A8E4